MGIPASRAVQTLGQSIWYDMIDRQLLSSGTLSRLIAEAGLAGLTSNPSIFEKAIAKSHEYDKALQQARNQSPQASPQELFSLLSIQDIREAADHFAALHASSGGRDGWVSLEVSPDIAYDTDATIDEATALYERVNRPNLMIKVPGTRAAIQAIEALIDRGINLNVTLLFSIERYQEIADAYLLGLEARLRRGQPLDKIRSVASFFISRVDTLLDRQLQSIISQGDSERGQRAQALLGKVAVANAKLAYQHYLELFTSSRFKALSTAGAHPQRLLWASTSTKNPNYDELLYVESLIGDNTVNTLPPDTFRAFNEQGKVASRLDQDIDQAKAVIKELAALGIDLAAATRQLEQDGVDAFADSYKNLLRAIDDKTARLSGTGS